MPVAVRYGGGKARAPMLERVDRTSAERWGKALDQIKAVGFNTIKCWVDWARAEPRSGDYRSESLDLLLRLAEERGLRVVIQLYLDSATDWVGERYPDGQVVERGGAVIKSQAAPGFSIDHPGVRTEVSKFLWPLSARAAAVTPEVRVSGTGTSEIEVRRLTGAGAHFLLAFNHARTAALATFSVRLPWAAARARNLTNGRTLLFRWVEVGVFFERRLEEGEILALKISSSGDVATTTVQ